MRVGYGYDVHRLVKGKPLILGGIEIPWEKGLSGHSDADVLTHALMDAMLGAAALGDIGRHFPDSDKKYKGISSILLLEDVLKLLKGKNYKMVNVDASIIAQKPKLLPYIPAMENKLASTLCLEPGSINIKATTTEALGFVGRQEGIAASVVVLIE